jgi:hypothetical protein
MARLSFFSLDGREVEEMPRIGKYGFKHLEDDPELHRWRAFWSAGESGPCAGGIALCAYPVIKKTQSAVWIHQYADLRLYDGVYRWVYDENSKIGRKLIHNGSNSAWAKPTQEDAIKSLAIRLTRWAAHVSNEAESVLNAVKSLEALRPDLKRFSDDAKLRIEGK